MADSWSAKITIQTTNPSALASALITEEEVKITPPFIEFSLSESRAKDLRAMLNTRLRSLSVCEEIVEFINQS